MHGRRISRWLGADGAHTDVRKLSRLGELVITFPPADRERMRTQHDLSDVAKVSRDTIQLVLGVSRGLRRWHFFGECPVCPEGSGCKGECGTPRVYHPHLNFLLDYGYIPPEKLQRLRPALKRNLGLSAEPTIWYHYADNPGMMYHRVKYITRPTFLVRRWDPELADELHGFHTTNSFGVWTGMELLWTLDDIGGEKPAVTADMLSLAKGICPIDGTHIVWGGVERGILLRQGIHYGNGYWRLGRRVRPPDFRGHGTDIERRIARIKSRSLRALVREYSPLWG